MLKLSRRRLFFFDEHRYYAILFPKMQDMYIG